MENSLFFFLIRLLFVGPYLWLKTKTVNKVFSFKLLIHRTSHRCTESYGSRWKYDRWHVDDMSMHTRTPKTSSVLVSEQNFNLDKARKNLKLYNTVQYPTVAFVRIQSFRRRIESNQHLKYF